MLICCHHTLRDVTFEERVAAAASAGYDAIGINLGAYRQLADEGRTDEELAEVLAAHGQRVHEIEALRNWSHDGEAKERSDALRELAFHIADTFGATYLQAVGPYEGDLAHAAASFAELCDRAADHGMVVGLEFLPSISNIPDVATGRALVEAAGRPNGGLCVDSWHFTRGNPDWDALGDLPGELVKGIQINDGTIEPEDPDYLHDCIANRRLCGEGEFDLVRFVQTLDRIGAAEVPYSVEIISDALAQRPAPEVAELTARSTRELLEAARGR